MIKKLLKVTLIILWILLIIGCTLFAFYDVEQRKTALVLLCLLLTVPTAILLIRRLLIRKKVKSFIDRVITAEKEAVRKTGNEKNPELLALDQSWKDAISRLRSSRLSRTGDPLYALPWYLVIGESRTGKSSMICNSGLSSPLAQPATSSTLNVTRNCDWWFFNEAIILDTAGRYTIPEDPQQDSVEWEEFLRQLARFRRKEPVNGIVAAISADKLLKLSSEALIEQGSLVRARIEQVMRSLGSNFPVYVMVTKMDLVFGMPEFFRAVPRSRLGQAMGWCNKSHAPCSDTVIDTAMNSISDNLRKLRSGILHETDTPEAEILIFPGKFQELSPGLRTFCQAVFTDNVYQVTPQFRGIYFSSAHQKIKHGGNEQVEPALSDQMLSGGMFLREFFTSILPCDRKLFRSVPEYAVRNFFDNTFFRIGWTTIWMVLLLLTWSGYRRNHSAFKPFMSIAPVIKETLPVNEVEQIRQEIHKLHQENSPVLPLRMGMHHSTTAEKQLKQYYLRTFEKNIHAPIAGAITTTTQKASPAFSEDSVMTAISFFTSLAELSPGHLFDSSDFRNYRSAAGVYLPILFPERSDSNIDKIIYQYGDWISWNDRNVIDNFRKFIYEQLSMLIEKKGDNLHWCTSFLIHGSNPVTLQNFWGSSSINQHRSDAMQVPGAFTKDGFRRIQDFLDQIDTRIVDQSVKESFKSKKISFYQWYWESFYQHWYAFMDQFSDGCKTDVSSVSARTFMLSVHDGTDPVIRFIQTFADELDSADTKWNKPVWRDQVLLLQETEHVSQEKSRDSSATGLTKTKNSFFGVFKKIGKESREYVDQNTLIRNRAIESSLASWNRYRSAVVALYDQALKPGGTLRFARILFVPEDSGSETYAKAFDAAGELKKKLFNDKADDALWRVITAPVTILRKIACNDAGMELQRRWETQVLSKLHKSAIEEQVDYLFTADSGLIHSFLADPFVSSFLQRAPSGAIIPVDGPDGPLQLSEDFIEFVNKGLRYSVKNEYPLTLQTVPFTVNDDATEEPYETILRFQCAEGATTLENFNNYEMIDFNYHPSSCGEVTLKAVFKSFTAVKTWSGKWGFPQFLMTLQDGVNVIKSDDFDPQYKERLQRKNIKWLRISYIIDPQKSQDIADILRNVPRNIPQKILEGQ